MLFKTIANNVSAFAIVLLGVSCVPNGKNSADSTNVSVAKPKQYKHIAANAVGVADEGLGVAVGSQLPNITVNDINNKNVSLSGYWADQPALVVFYRGGWCPYCNMQVQELSRRYQEFKAAGIQPVLISVDAPDKAAMLDTHYEIPFPVLSDSALKAHTAFNVLLTLDSVTLAKYKMFGIIPKDWSGKKHNTIAVASAFVVDTKGVVRAAHASKDFASRPSAEQLLTLAKSVL